MKNISGKTLVFYSFQQKKQSQYNVVAFQPQQAVIRIKDVLEQLPIDLSQGNYHFRFKSQFFESDEKIVGWIDISNLMAKVPLVNGSIYIKILKVKANQYNKLFNLDKLRKVGLANGKPQLSKQEFEAINSHHNNSIHKKHSQSAEQVHRSKLTPKKSQNPINLIGQDSPIRKPQSKKPDPKPKTPVIQQPEQNGDFIQFQKHPQPFVSNQTPEQRLKRFRQISAAQDKDKQDELQAKTELDGAINKWGYSGAKTLNNLTTLLSTLHEIWPEWQQVSFTDLMKPEQLAIVCKKALVTTHPDKNRKKQFRQKYLAKRVFQLLNDAKKAT